MKLLDILHDFLNEELARKNYNNKSVIKKYIQKYDFIGKQLLILLTRLTSRGKSYPVYAFIYSLALFYNKN